MTTVKLYVHKYLGCLCLVVDWIRGQEHIYSYGHEIDYWSRSLAHIQETFWDSPECWELLDSWEE